MELFRENLIHLLIELDKLLRDKRQPAKLIHRFLNL